MKGILPFLQFAAICFLSSSFGIPATRAAQVYFGNYLPTSTFNTHDSAEISKNQYSGVAITTVSKNF
ncbi:MAG: hypothetical protein ACK5LK_09725 [Chthoniobacterales bacterium]